MLDYWGERLLGSNNNTPTIHIPGLNEFWHLHGCVSEYQTRTIKICEGFFEGTVVNHHWGMGSISIDFKKVIVTVVPRTCKSIFWKKNLGGKLVLQLFVWQVRTDALLPPSPHNTFQARMRWVDVVWVDHVVCWNEFAFVNKEDWVCQSIHRCLKNHETKQ